MLNVKKSYLLGKAASHIVCNLEISILTAAYMTKYTLNSVKMPELIFM